MADEAALFSVTAGAVTAGGTVLLGIATAWGTAFASYLKRHVEAHESALKVNEQARLDGKEMANKFADLLRDNVRAMTAFEATAQAVQGELAELKDEVRRQGEGRHVNSMPTGL